MKTYKKKTVKSVDKIYCDVCGESCTTDNFGSEYAVLEAAWGYASNHGGTMFELQICEYCFFDIIKYMKNKKKIHHNDAPDDPFFGKTGIII